jgi:hypothetical protein
LGSVRTLSSVHFICTYQPPANTMHSFRNGIAQYLASMRIEVWLIQGLLRHSFNSQTVWRYIREAHVMAATDLAEQATRATDINAVRAELRMLQNATADSRSVQNPPVKRTAGGHPLPIMDKDDLEAGEQDKATQSWTPCSPGQLGRTSSRKHSIRVKPRKPSPATSKRGLPAPRAQTPRQTSTSCT